MKTKLDVLYATTLTSHPVTASGTPVVHYSDACAVIENLESTIAMMTGQLDRQREFTKQAEADLELKELLRVQCAVCGEWVPNFSNHRHPTGRWGGPAKVL